MPVFWLCAVKACAVAAAVLLFCLLVAVSYTAVVGYGHRALPSTLRESGGKHPHIDCKVRNTEGVDCRVSGESLASLPTCLGN